MTEKPDSSFYLHADASPSVFIADHSGIGQLEPLIQTLARRGRRLQIHYGGDSLAQMPFAAELQAQFERYLFIYLNTENRHMDALHILADAPHNAFFYVCGKRDLIDAIDAAARALGLQKDRVQGVSTSPEKPHQKVVVELARSQKLIQLDNDESILDAVRAAGVKVNFDCYIGDCGSCATRVIAGDVEHRDHVLSDDEKARGKMCLCVSRARSDRLTLDL